MMNHFSRAEKLVLLFLLFIAALLVMRISYADNLRFTFLLWNLFLAWIPFQLAIELQRRLQWPLFVKIVVASLWLLFFPNALYIITDLIHLDNGIDRVPLWFDALLLFSAALTGLIMAFVSLFCVERFLDQQIGKNYAGKLTWIIIFMGSFGVYLGRFQRWNSWDVVTNPFSVMMQTAAHVVHPVGHYHTWVITFILGCFFSLLYTGCKMLGKVFVTNTVQ